MDAIAAVKLAFEGSHRWYQGTIEGVTADQACQVPPGVAHPIGELAAHILHSEDGMVNMVLQGKPMVWERDGWAARLGLPVMMDQQTAAARAYKCDPRALQEYAQAVYRSTEAYLDGLEPADLEREADLSAAGMPSMPLGAFLLTMLLGNNYAHTGEISALKGLQGLRGYPF